MLWLSRLWLPTVLTAMAIGRASVAAPSHAPDEIIVKFKEGKTVNRAALETLNGATFKRGLEALGYVTLKLPKGSDPALIVSKLRQNPDVRYAGLNHVVRIASVFPNDPVMEEGWDPLGIGLPLVSPQWGLYNPPSRIDIHAPEAWDVTVGSPDVVIAVLDTGVDYTHPDLFDKLWLNLDEAFPVSRRTDGIDNDLNGYVDDWRGWDFANGDNDPIDDHIDPDYGLPIHHGTFTAAIAAASTDNDEGVAGVAWNCPVMALKVMDSTGYGLEDVAAQAVLYAVNKGAKVINMSITGENTPALKAALDYAWAQGSLCVCASGNEALTVDTYPASYSSAISVGAVNEAGVRCSSADWGPGQGSNYGSYLDLMAPGNNITSATDMFQPGGYGSLPGTSAAAPFVSGVAALIWSVHPDWPVQDVFSQLILTATDVGTPGWDIETGWGIVNAHRAVTETIQTLQNVASAKNLASGGVKLNGVVVSAGSGQIPSRMYVQDQGRGSGILLSFPGGVPDGFLEGDVVNVIGASGEVSGERAIINPIVSKVSSGTAPAPFVMRNPFMGGGQSGLQEGVVDRYSFPRVMATGANNIGSLVTVYGKVTAVGFDWFYLDDESHLDDGTGYSGIYVHCPNVQRPALGKYVVATGISSCERPSGSPVLRRILRPRKQGDLLVSSL